MPLVVAIDGQPEANLERVKQELVAERAAGRIRGDAVHSGVGEDRRRHRSIARWFAAASGGELKAAGMRRPGIVIEARLDKGRGPVATVLVQSELAR